MIVSELVVFIVYLIFLLGVGIFFFLKGRDSGEKDFFLGGRQMGAWVSGLSAGASDMSAWVLMGLPASIYASGLGQTWIAIGLFIGYALSWIFVAPRLRTFSMVCNDSITIPQYLANRFLAKNKSLQVVCAVIFLVAYTVYSSSSIKACGTLFNTVLGMDAKLAMYIAAIIIVGITFLGGFSAVCWTDFFQGLLMLGALFMAPIAALFMLPGGAAQAAGLDGGFFKLFTSWQDIISGLGWGLGYFGMPHIIIRFMSIKSSAEMKKARTVGIGWTFFILLFAVIVAIVGRLFLGGGIDDSSKVFITMVRKIFAGPWLGIISGLLLSAILAAAMSTADSQLLAASSSFASDVYKPIIRKDQASDKEMLWVGRIVVVVITVIAMFIATNPNSGTIMSLVENAWGLFGAAFGPVILLSLFWKKYNFSGAITGILVGAVVDVLWLVCCKGTGIYEIVPGFLAGLIASYIAAKASRKDEAELSDLFAKCVEFDG